MVILTKLIKLWEKDIWGFVYKNHRKHNIVKMSGLVERLGVKCKDMKILVLWQDLWKIWKKWELRWFSCKIHRWDVEGRRLGFAYKVGVKDLEVESSVVYL